MLSLYRLTNNRICEKHIINMPYGGKEMAKILVVDDDQGIRDFLEIMLTREGYDVTCADDANKAIGRCKREKFDLILTDLRMPKVDGIEFLKAVKEIISTRRRPARQIPAGNDEKWKLIGEISRYVQKTVHKHPSFLEKF